MKTFTPTPEPPTSSGVEWFAGYLPKPAKPPLPEVVPPSHIPEVRAEIEAVSRHLMDPGAAGIRAAIPHLERAIAAFSTQLGETRIPSPKDRAGIDALRTELGRANRLFEQAYEIHAVWATQLGIHMDGTPRQLLYGRPSQAATTSAAQDPAAGMSVGNSVTRWEG